LKKNQRKPEDEPPHPTWIKVLTYSLIFVAAPILTFLTGRFLDEILLLPEFPPFPVNLIAGFFVFFSGLTVGIKATRLLYFKGRGLPWGEIRRKDESTRLVTTGLYACCRNPMTFGYSLLPCGMGILLRSLAMTILIPAFIFSVMIIWLKLWEEPRLERRFGEAYRAYKNQTPFLIPRFKPLLIDITRSAESLLHREKAEVLETERPHNGR
jgi:protein-S-isoprenylcysteine O-methyltransferase Ste14